MTTFYRIRTNVKRVTFYLFRKGRMVLVKTCTKLRSSILKTSEFLICYAKEVLITERSVLITIIVIQTVYIGYRLYTQQPASVCTDCVDPVVFTIRGYPITRSEMFVSYILGGTFLLFLSRPKPELSKRICLDYLWEVSNKGKG